MSARWAEMMPGRCVIRYSSSKAQDVEDMEPGGKGAAQPSVVVDIGKATPDETRWWAAVLAPGRGWLAATTRGKESFWSPWCTRIQSGPQFAISRWPRSCKPPPTRFKTITSSREALRFLNKFCIRHGVVAQSHAALAAVLLLPSVPDSTKLLRLPTVVVNQEPTSVNKEPASYLRHDWLFESPEMLDRLVTLGCNVHSTESMLLSAFYEPGIECNAVTPWLQGALDVIDSIVVNKPLVFGRMIMERRPSVAFLWVGAIILGLDKELLASVRLGRLPCNLNAAAWSGSEQSFLQQPVREPLEVNGMITRADQCRLLAMWRATRPFVEPECPWAPSGSTSLEHVDPDVRLHSSCGGHQLQLLGFVWRPDPAVKPINAPGITAIEEGSDTTPPEPRQLALDDWEMYFWTQTASNDATHRTFVYMTTINPFSHYDQRQWMLEWLTMDDSLTLTAGPSDDEETLNGKTLVGGGGSESDHNGGREGKSPSEPDSG